MADLTEAEARESVATAKRGLEAAAEEIVRQISGRAWLALGYESWDEMRKGEYDGPAVIVPRAGRPEIVAQLREEGLSQRQVGETLGVSDQTVSRDVRQMSDVSSPTRIDSLGRSQPTSKPRRPMTELVDEAVAQFPDLSWYAERDRAADVMRLATALRGYDEPEQSMRIEMLRKTIAAEQRRPVAAPEPPTVDHQRLAREMFAACNDAAKTISRNGAADTLAAALSSAAGLEVENWAGQFDQLAEQCAALARACRPQLRRIK